MSQYPPASLYPVAYNVQPGDVKDTNLDGPETQYFRTRPRVPPLSLRECDDTNASLNACVRRYLRDGGFPEFDEFGDELWNDISNVGDLVGDRTVNATFGYLGILTPSFVSSIQRDVLAERTRWRILFTIDQDRENFVAIYPDAFSIGSAFYQELDAPIAAWQQRMREWEEREYGAFARQFRYLKARIPVLQRRLSKTSFVIAGLFDNWDGDETRHSLWLAYYASDYEDVSVKDEIVSEGHKLLVDESGRLRTSSFETYEWLQSIDTAPVRPLKVRLRIRQYVLPAASEYPLTVKIRPKRKKVAIHLSATDFITDAELKRRFAT